MQLEMWVFIVIFRVTSVKKYLMSISVINENKDSVKNYVMPPKVYDGGCNGSKKGDHKWIKVGSAKYSDDEESL